MTLNQEINVRPVERDDIDVVVGIHLASFQTFFLSSLGPKFLWEMYRSFLADADCVSFIARYGQAPVGFVFGSTQPTGLYTRLLRRRLLPFALAALGPFCRRPVILPRLLRAFTMPAEPLPAAGCASLMSIAVLPGTQGKGVGEQLVRAFVAECEHRHTSGISLTTDAENNERTNRFYRRLGFTVFRTFTTPEGRAMHEYWLPLGRPARTG